MTLADFPEIFAREATKFTGTKSTKAGGLALSGGGFRAMLFHVGTLRRLHEVGALGALDRISSVSGGSIAAARLALNWDQLQSGGNGTVVFQETVQDPLFGFAGKRIDVSAGIAGMLRPKRSIAESVARKYEPLLESNGLAQLPDEPRFVFCSTNLGTGSLVRFAKIYTADRRVGKRDGLDLPLTTVVAASAAFPPVLSPMRITLEQSDALTEQFPGDEPELKDTAYSRELELSDGGVYDNLGLQPLEQFHTLLVSDGGGPFLYDDSVATNWLQHMIRAWKVTDNQVRSLRKSHLVDALVADRRKGTYWGITTGYSDYGDSVLAVDDSWANYLIQVPTRLDPIPKDARKQLINFAYCLTDAALRTFVIGDGTNPKPDLPAPALPYPEQPLDQPAPKDYKQKPIWKFWG